MKRKTLLALFIGAVISAPLSANVTLSVEAKEGEASQSKPQAAGYIGEMSRSVIHAGNLERLQSGAVSAEQFIADDSLSDRIRFWHNVALDTVALDHTPSGEEGAPVNQGGPTRTSRALAMVQISVFEALNAIDRQYNGYIEFMRGFRRASPDAAIAQATFSSLKRLYPAQRERLRAILDEDLARIRATADRDAFRMGRDLGRVSASRVAKKRRGDGSRRAEVSYGEGGAVADGFLNYAGKRVNTGNAVAGEWSPDPNTPENSGDAALALGSFWGKVAPFAIRSGNQFRAPVPPALNSAEYAAAYNEVAAIGGAQDNVATPSTGTDATRFIGNYWGYDGVPLIGVPPRVYNQIAIQVAQNEIDDPLDLARYLAMVNVAMADAAISAWDSKYFYNLWRPVVGIRVDDGNDFTVADETWNPVGVSVINTTEAIRPTPPFPAYPSGHAAFGGATFEVMREFFGDDTPFTFVSDEFNGEGVDPFFPNVPRPFVPVRFDTLTDAQIENGVSRVYNGVHWNFDDTAGQEMGVGVARYLIDEVRAFTER